MKEIVGTRLWQYTKDKFYVKFKFSELTTILEKRVNWCSNTILELYMN